MFRKSIAVLLALWFPLGFSLQGCARGGDPIVDGPNPGACTTLACLQQDQCALRGGDTDGDKICDDDEVTTGPLLAPTPSGDPTKCLDNADCNENEIPDDKDGWAWAKTPLATAIEGFILGAATIWIANGVTNGNWNPFKHKDADSVKPAGATTLSAPGLSMKATELGSATSEVNILPAPTDATKNGTISVLSFVTYPLPLEITNDKGGKLSIHEVAYCIRSDYVVTETATANGHHQATLQLQLPNKYLNKVSPEKIADGSYGPNKSAIEAACRNGKKGAWISFKGINDADPYMLETLPLTFIGLKPTDTQGKGAFTATSVIQFSQTLTSDGTLKFIDSVDPSRSTKEYHLLTLNYDFIDQAAAKHPQIATEDFILGKAYDATLPKISDNFRFDLTN